MVGIVPPRPIQFQKAMVFIDGTNFFHRLAEAKLRLISISGLYRHVAQGRQIVRAYLYTSAPHYEKAEQVHGKEVFEDVRVVFGDAIPSSPGNFKEKGVDALLVADLIYHAAAKNYDYAILISADQDFARALTRVEDFGCRTAAISIGAQTPDLLRQSCDDLFEIDVETLIHKDWASQL
jgi:uncharacterized LabA/DUF88 family protein